MDEKTLDQLISIHDQWKMLNWWQGEDRFQIIVETIATQQCKLIEGSTWAYELKLLADECTKGNMIDEVEVELEDWLKKNGTTWKIEADKARKKSDWSQNRIRYIEDNPNRKASIATRSLWASYGRNFPKRVAPEFITVKEWSNDHKEWLLNVEVSDIIDKMTFKIIASKRKLQGIKEFIGREKDGEFRDLTGGNAIQKLKSIASVGDETARKIALFYFDIPLLIFDLYLLRISIRHQWISSQSEIWDAKNRGDIENSVRFWLRNSDAKTQSKNIKSIHAVIDDCGNLYCKKEANCNICPLSILLPSEMTMTLSPDQIVPQGVSNEALIRLLMKKGVFTKEEFLAMVRVVNQEVGKTGGRDYEDRNLIKKVSSDVSTNCISELESIYKQIHTCNRCLGMKGGSIRVDERKVRKKAFEQYLTSEIFMVGQSLASNQVRLSGIPFHNPQGEMSRGGKFLEKYLNNIGYTLSPNKPNCRLAYMSDIVQCYPGKRRSGTGDNIPNGAEIENCWKWLLEEMKLISFRIVLLLGSQAARTFFKLFIGGTVNNASEYYCRQKNFRFNNIDIPVFILPHPSSRVKDRSEIYHKTFENILNTGGVKGLKGE